MQQSSRPETDIEWSVSIPGEDPEVFADREFIGQAPKQARKLHGRDSGEAVFCELYFSPFGSGTPAIQVQRKRTVGPVSYTHLDVYKRQVPSTPPSVTPLWLWTLNKPKLRMAAPSSSTA